MKRLLTLLLVGMMLFSIIPAMPTVVSAAGDEENLALGMPVTVLATSPTSDPQRIVDGNTTNAWNGPSGVDGNWIMVDLGKEYEISSVVMHLPLDSSLEARPYRRHLTVQFSKTPDFAVMESIVALGEKESEVGVPVTVSPKSRTTYRYVRVVKMINTTHILCELEVYGQEPSNEISIGEDVKGTSKEGPVSLLTHLGMVGLEDEGNEIFGVNTVLTRAEAAAMMVDVFAGDFNVNGAIPFTDVKQDHKNYTDVVTAYHLGYMVGDGEASFRPNDYITKAEFLSMVVSALGYYDILQKQGGNALSNAIQLANSMNLLKGVSSENYNDLVTRGDAAVIFYNALLAPNLNISSFGDDYYEYAKDTNILRDRYGLVLTEGIVKENGISTLDGEPKASKNAAAIGSQPFHDPQRLLDDYLGHSVVVATSVDDPKTIVLAWLTQKDEEIILPADKLLSTEADIAAKQIVAYDPQDDEETTYPLDDYFKVIKNGMAQPYYAESDILISNGQLRLLDNNRDGLYDVVFIEEFTLHYVEMAFYDDKELTFLDSNGERKTIEREFLRLTNASGSTATPKTVKRGVLLKLFDNGSGQHCKMVVYNNPVKGVLSGLSDDDLKVDSASYPLSFAYKSAVHPNMPEVGSVVDAFVDAAGEVLWLEEDLAASNDGWTVAFSQKINIGKGIDPQLLFKVYTINGQWKELYIADKLTLDGTVVQKSALSNMIKNASVGRFSSELLRYKLNSEGKINNLDTVAVGGEFNYHGAVPNSMYAPDTQAFWTADTNPRMILAAKTNTPTFIIPRMNNGQYATSNEYDRFYRISNVRSETPAQHQGQVAQNLQAYMLDEDGYPKCFLKPEVAPTTSSSSSNLEVVESPSASFMLVESTCYALDSNGEVSLKVTGRTITKNGLGDGSSFMAKPELKMVETGLLYQDDEGTNYVKTSGNDDYGMLDKTKVLSLDEAFISSVEDIQFGDIVRYQSATPTVSAVERVFHYDPLTEPDFGDSGMMNWYGVGGSVRLITAHNRFQIGSISSVSETAFTITTPAINPDTSEYAEETYQNASFAKIVVCDHSKKRATLELVKDLSRYVDTSAKLMLFSSSGTPRVIIVYPY